MPNKAGITAGKVWGQTHKVFDQNNVEMDVIHGDRGFACSTHIHDQKFNTFHCITGVWVIEVIKDYLGPDKPDNRLTDQTVLRPGMTCRVSPGDRHRFVCVQAGICLEIYHTEIRGDDIRRDDTGHEVSESELELLDRLCAVPRYGVDSIIKEQTRQPSQPVTLSYRMKAIKALAESPFFQAWCRDCLGLSMPKDIHGENQYDEVAINVLKRLNPGQCYSECIRSFTDAVRSISGASVPDDSAIWTDTAFGRLLKDATVIDCTEDMQRLCGTVTHPMEGVPTDTDRHTWFQPRVGGVVDRYGSDTEMTPEQTESVTHLSKNDCLRHIIYKNVVSTDDMAKASGKFERLVYAVTRRVVLSFQTGGTMGAADLDTRLMNALELEAGLHGFQLTRQRTQFDDSKLLIDFSTELGFNDGG